MARKDGKAVSKKENEQRRAEEEKRARRHNIIIVAIAVAVIGAVIGACLLFLNLPYFYTHGTAVEVEGTELSVTEYNFYFYRAYYEYLNNIGGTSNELGMNLKPDESVPLRRQLAYSDSENKGTWRDYFVTRADTLIARTFKYYRMALEAGFTLTDEQLEDIEYDFEEKIKFEAEDINMQTVGEYLEKYYGKGMTEEIYKENLRILFTANFFEEAYKSSIAIPDSELDAFYNEDPSKYTAVYFRQFYVSGKTDDEAEKQEKLTEAKTIAEELAAKSTDRDTYISLCEEYKKYNDADSYWTGGSSEVRNQIRYCTSYFQDWLAEPTRKSGDIGVIEAVNGYYVLLFEAAYDNNYPVARLKYITVTDKAGLEQSQAKAEEFLAKFYQSDQTAASFFELAADYRDFNYSIDNRRIDAISYDSVTKATVPSVMSNWVFDETRSEGDVSMFVSKDEQCVYIAYYDGFGMLASRSIAYSDMSKKVFDEWKANVLDGVEIKDRELRFLAEHK